MCPIFVLTTVLIGSGSIFAGEVVSFLIKGT
jgi:hypothetical protein